MSRLSRVPVLIAGRRDHRANSDINITSRETRRTVMLHGLLSFFFNTMVIALVVNLTAQFAG
jgi:uncharacterized membrane protein